MSRTDNKYLECWLHTFFKSRLLAPYKLKRRNYWSFNKEMQTHTPKMHCYVHHHLSRVSFLFCVPRTRRSIRSNWPPIAPSRWPSSESRRWRRVSCYSRRYNNANMIRFFSFYFLTSNPSLERIYLNSVSSTWNLTFSSVRSEIWTDGWLAYGISLRQARLILNTFKTNNVVRCGPLPRWKLKHQFPHFPLDRAEV